MAKVFISRSWNDNDISRRIAHDLRRDGAEIWIDYARIKAGDTLPERISNALEWCDTLVLVWSKSAEASYWVKKEWQSALTLKKEIIPCIIDDTPLPAILCSLIYIDFKDFNQGYKHLLEALEQVKPIQPPNEPKKPARPKNNIPTQKILKIAAIFLAIVILGFSANYVVQKIAAAREAKKAYWQKRQTEMNARFHQAQQNDSDDNKSTSDKKQIWQQFLIDFAADNPYSQQDNIQRQEGTKQRDRWDNQAKLEARWAQFQADMNRSYKQALQREKLSSIPAADKAKRWQEFWDQYANKDNPYSQEDNEKMISATQKKDFWLKQVARETEQARWEHLQAAIATSYNNAKRRDQNNSLSPDEKIQTWQNFLTNYADDNPLSNQDNIWRKYANDRITYWSNYIPPATVIASPPQQKTVKGMTLVLIRGGTFDMGDTFGDVEADEKPVHSVTVSDFYMGKTEVTVGQFRKFVESTGYKTDAEKQGWAYAWTESGWDKVNGASWLKPGFAQTDNHPVVYISWNDANEFCKWASCRLSTEAEWEYEARNKGQSIKYSWGNSKPIGRKGANVADESAKKKFPDWTIFEGYNDGYVFTAPVASYDANELDLYDMSGNVWEWCSDWYDSDYYKNSPRNNPKGPASGTARVLRGGSWDDDPRGCRAAFRGRVDPENRLNYTGFRVVQDSSH